MKQFQDALSKVLEGKIKVQTGYDKREFDKDICLISCYHGPDTVLIAALSAIILQSGLTLADVEPPVLTDNVDLYMNPDGTIDLRDGDKPWEKITV